MHSFYFSCSFNVFERFLDVKFQLTLTWLFSITKLICPISDNPEFCYTKIDLHLHLCDNF